MLAVTTLGCHHLKRSGHTKSNYETVQAQPNQNQAEAIRLTRLASSQLKEGDLKAAKITLEEALAQDVSYGPAHNNLGQLYFSMDKFYLAAWEFEYAARVMPNRPEPLNNLGLVYEAVGQPERALEQFELAYALDSRNPEVIGNLVRARFEIDQRDPLAYELLRELLMFDTRPHWVAWAKETLAFERQLAYEEVETDTAEPGFERLPPPDVELPTSILHGVDAPLAPVSYEAEQVLSPVRTASGTMRRFP